MAQLREAVGCAAFVLGAAALAAVNHHPTHGRRSERERAAIQAAAVGLTHQQIVDAWELAKGGNPEPLLALQQTFPLPPQTVHAEGRAIVLSFAARHGTCVSAGC